MKRKAITFILILTIICSNLFSIGFGYHVFEVKTSPDFAKGVFPTSLLYQFNFPVPDFIKDQTTEVAVRLDNGLDFRTLRQHPTTGVPFASNPTDPSFNYPKDYMTLFDELNVVLGQGFIKTRFSEKDTLKLWLTLDLRFERAFERLDYLRDPSNMEGLFQITPRIEEPYTKPDAAIPAVPRFDTWTGQPELGANDRYTSNMSVSIGLDFNMMSDKITRRNGIKNSFWVRLNPSWMNLFGNCKHDFLFFWDKLDLAWTPFAVKQNGERNTTWFSIVLDNSTTYRYIMGSMIPAYLQHGYIFGTRALNTEHVLTNRTSITLYGPQINSYDCYPYISGFVDVGLSAGNLLNTAIPKSYFDTVTSIGMRTEFIIFNIASFYYEIGYILDNVLEEPAKQTVMRFGFTFGV